jgi:imidazolonepropionase-like amidohydrolase
VADSAKYAKGFFPEVVRKKGLEICPQLKATAGKAYNKGVKIAFGTDSGVSPHGSNNQEFVLMAEIGMKNADILRSATIDAATMLKMADKIGSLEPGKLADIVAVEDDPLTNIRTMLKVVFVMKDGVRISDER